MSDRIGSQGQRIGVVRIVIVVIAVVVDAIEVIVVVSGPAPPKRSAGRCIERNQE